MPGDEEQDRKPPRKRPPPPPLYLAKFVSTKEVRRISDYFIRLTIYEKIDVIRNTLALTVVEFGQIMGVKKRAVYKWLSGLPMRNRNKSRLDMLIRVLVAARVVSEHVLQRRFVFREILIGTPSLFELLCRKDWRFTQLVGMLKMAWAYSLHARSLWSRRKGLPVKDVVNKNVM